MIFNEIFRDWGGSRCREAASYVGVPARVSVIHVLKRSQMENKTTECSKSNAIDIFNCEAQVSRLLENAIVTQGYFYFEATCNVSY